MDSLHLFTHEFYPTPGGAGAVVENLAKAAVSTLGNVPVTVWAPVHPDLPPERDGYQIVALPVKGKQGWPDRLRHTAAVRPRLGELEKGFVHLGEPGALRSWMDLAKHFPPKIPRLGITLHGSEILKLTSPPSRRAKFVALCRRAEWIHLLSNHCAQLFQQSFPGFEERVRVTGGACTIEDPGIADALPADPPDRDRRVRFLSVGRLHPRKGQLALVQALARMQPDFLERIEVRIIGPTVRGTYARAVSSVISAHRLPVTLLGRLDASELEAEYRQADCFVFPSQPSGRSIEGLGLACLDASLFGLPVIASDIGGVREAVLHGQTGLLVDPGDPADFEKALRMLVEDDGLRRRLGTAGRKFAASLDWQTIARSLYTRP